MKNLIFIFIFSLSLFANTNFDKFYPNSSSLEIFVQDIIKKAHKKGNANLSINNNIENFEVYKILPELHIKPKNPLSEKNNLTDFYSIKVKTTITPLKKEKGIYYINGNPTLTISEMEPLDYLNVSDFIFSIRQSKLSANTISLVSLEIDNIYYKNKALLKKDKPYPNLKYSYIFDNTGLEKEFKFGSIWKILTPNVAGNTHKPGEYIRPTLMQLDKNKAKMSTNTLTRVAGRNVYIAFVHQEIAGYKLVFKSTTLRPASIYPKANNIIIYNYYDVVSEPTSLALGSYVLEVLNPPVGKHDICYQILDYNGVEVDYGCREFHVRPYSVNIDDTNIIAGKNQKSNNIISLKANTLDWQDRNLNIDLDIKSAVLKALNSNANSFEFDLENTKNEKITSTTPAFIKNNKLDLIINYPFAGKTEVSFKENDFVGSDIANNKCIANSSRAYFDGEGKIGCDVYIKPINIEFTSDTKLNLAKIKTSNDLSNAVLFSDEVIGYHLGDCSGINCDFTHALKLPINIINLGFNDASSLKNVYKIFEKDLFVDFDFKFSNNKDLNAAKRYRVFLDKINLENGLITNKNILLNTKISKDELNKIFDKKLNSLYEKTHNEGKKLSEVSKDYEALKDDLSFTTKLGYTKLYESNNYAPSTTRLSKYESPEFNIDANSTITLDKKDIINLDNTYSFIFAYARYKDYKTNTNSMLLPSSDFHMYYLNKAGKEEKLYKTTQINNFYYLKPISKILDGFIIKSDYNSLVDILPNGDLLISVNKENIHKQYLKDLIRMYSTNEIGAKGVFTIEFKK